MEEEGVCKRIGKKLHIAIESGKIVNVLESIIMRLTTTSLVIATPISVRISDKKKRRRYTPRTVPRALRSRREPGPVNPMHPPPTIPEAETPGIARAENRSLSSSPPPPLPLQPPPPSPVSPLPAEGMPPAQPPIADQLATVIEMQRQSAQQQEARWETWINDFEERWSQHIHWMHAWRYKPIYEGGTN
jgi:hypothetical protein